MGAGDRYLQPSFTVPMPAAVETWPFERRPPRAYCPLCDRPLDFCECKDDMQYGGGDCCHKEET